MYDLRDITSGYPLGNINSSGITSLNLCLGLPFGGEGFVEYSVKLKFCKLGVRGLLLLSISSLCPLTAFSATMAAMIPIDRLKVLKREVVGFESPRELVYRNCFGVLVGLFSQAISGNFS